MNKSTEVVDKLMQLKEEEHNYLYIHGNTNTDELTFIVKGDSDILASAIIQAMHEDRNLLDLLKTAIYAYDFEQKGYKLN